VASYRASDYGVILLPYVEGRSRTLNPGATLPPGALSSDQIREHVKSGYLVPLGAGEQDRSIPGVETLQLQDDPNYDVKAKSDKDSQPSIKKVKVTRKPPAGVHGKWNMDPKVLEEKNLNQLNVLIKDRDKRRKAFETKADAVNWLSQDFNSDS